MVVAVQARRALPPRPLLLILSRISSSTSSVPPRPLPIPWEGWLASPVLPGQGSNFLPASCFLPPPPPSEHSAGGGLRQNRLVIREAQAEELQFSMPGKRVSPHTASHSPLKTLHPPTAALDRCPQEKEAGLRADTLPSHSSMLTRVKNKLHLSNLPYKLAAFKPAGSRDVSHFCIHRTGGPPQPPTQTWGGPSGQGT